MTLNEDEMNLKDIEGRIFDRLRLFLALPDLTRKIIYDISRDIIHFINTNGERRILYGPNQQKEKLMMIQGCQIVDWMIENNISKTRQNSAYIAQWLINAGELQSEESENSMELFDSTIYYFLPLMESIMFLRQNVIHASVLQQHSLPATNTAITSTAASTSTNTNSTGTSTSSSTCSTVRYAVLTRQNRLYFYANDQSVIPIESIHLDPSVTRLQLLSSNEDIPSLGLFSFLLDTLNTKKEYRFTCRHEQDRKLWIDKLQRLNLVYRENYTTATPLENVNNFYECYDRFPNGKIQSMKSYENKLCLVVTLPYNCNDKNDREEFKRLSLLQKAHDPDLIVLAFPSFDIEKQIDHEKASVLEDVNITVPPHITVPEETYQDVYTYAKDQLCDFPIFEVEKIYGSLARPVYRYLSTWSKSNTLDNMEISSHYTKYLIDYKGIPIKRYDKDTKPTIIQDDIERLVTQYTGRP